MKLLIKKRLSSLPRNIVIGVAGVVLMYVGIAGMDSAVTPWWLGRGDAPRHIDYALSVYNLDIPRFNDRLQYPVFNQLAEGKYGNQPAAVNPPLFYIIHAPVVGPSLESGHWERAIALGRSLNMAIGVLCILALSWAGWIFGGRRKNLFAVSVPAIGALSFNFTILNQNYAVDVLLVFWSILTFILSYFMLKEGPNKKYLYLLVILSLLGMATKATYIVLLFISLLALVISYVLNSKKAKLKNTLKGAFVAVLILAIVVFTVGWYYYFQNYRLSGNWASSAPDNFGSPNRPYKSFEYVITSSNLWGMFYERIAASELVSKMITAAAILGLATATVRKRYVLAFRNKEMLAMIFLMATASLGILATQIVHAVGYGGFYFRYFLPVILPISLLLSYGLLEFKSLRGQLVFLSSIFLGYTTLEYLVSNSAIRERVPLIVEKSGIIDKIYFSAESQNISSLVPTILFMAFVAGAIMLSLSLFRLTSKNGTIDRI